MCFLKVCTCFMIVHHRSVCIFMYLNVLVHCFSIRCGHFQEEVSNLDTSITCIMCAYMKPTFYLTAVPRNNL